MKQKTKRAKNFSKLAEIKLPDYKKIASQVKRRKVLVQEGEVESVLRQLQLSRAKLTLKQGPAQKGDFVKIEYLAPEIERGKLFKDAFILGKGFFVPGFEKNLEGMENGERKDFSLLFPKDYFQEELKGKKIEFEMEMKAVNKVELPEINDGFAKDLGNFEDLVALKESIEEGLKSEKEIYETLRVRREILDKIRRVVKIALPKMLIEEEKEYLMKELKKSPFFTSTFAKTKKSKGEGLSQSLWKAAEKRLKNSLIIREISRREGILVSEDEINNKINEMVKNYPSEKIKEVDLNLLKGYTKGVIIEEKVFQLLENV